MGYPATVIPEKIFFKIGEVCDLVGVQAHVLRYWETEFPMLSPQKNRSGQRTYRRRDVEIALRIKELLYDDLYTIAGAKKKLQSELRDASRLKIVHSAETAAPPPSRTDSYIKEVKVPEPVEIEHNEEVEDFHIEDIDDNFDEIEVHAEEEHQPLEINEERREALVNLAAQLLELREMLRVKKNEDAGFRQRNF